MVSSVELLSTMTTFHLEKGMSACRQARMQLRELRVTIITVPRTILASDYSFSAGFSHCARKLNGGNVDALNSACRLTLVQIHNTFANEVATADGGAFSRYVSLSRADLGS